MAFLGIFVCGYTKTKYGEHLSMKEGSLFCFVLMRSTKPGKLSRRRVHGLGFMASGLAE